MKDELLIKYIVGEASIEEQRLLEHWLEASATNRLAYERLLTIWENSKREDDTNVYDVDTAWEQFKEQKSRTLLVAPPRRLLVRWKAYVAAAALLVLFCSVFAYWMLSPTEYTADVTTRVLSLPDHSIVVLNNQSKLTYKQGFNKKDRAVVLEGEGFFDVFKNADKPFVIQVGDVDVKVVGTSFNIRSNAELIEIVVETGVVEVAKGADHFVLKADDKLVFKKHSAKPEFSKVKNKLYQYYRTNIFIADNLLLGDLLEGLSNAYAVPIRVAQPHIAQMHITSKFPKTSDVEPILKNIALTLNLQLLKEQDGYLLR